MLSCENGIEPAKVTITSSTQLPHAQDIAEGHAHDAVSWDTDPVREGKANAATSSSNGGGGT